MRSVGKFGLPRFIANGNVIHFIRTVYDVLSRSAAGNRRFNSSRGRGGLVPGEDDQLVERGPEVITILGTRSRALSWRSGETIHHTACGSPSVDLDSLTGWTKSYFESWRPAFPFLHGPEVLELLKKLP